MLFYARIFVTLLGAAEYRLSSALASFVDDDDHITAGVFDPLTPRTRKTMATTASLSKDLGCGTVFLLNFVHQTSRW